MLVLTPHNIHILCGFVAKKSFKSSKLHASSATNTTTSTADCLLEWVSPLQQQEHFNKLNTTNKTAALSLDEQNDIDWVEDIWKELLRSDLGYSRFPLAEVYSFFRRRHQLKYTAMEITDVMGYSVLYACDSVEVKLIFFVNLAVHLSSNAHTMNYPFIIFFNFRKTSKFSSPCWNPTCLRRYLIASSAYTSCSF